MAVSIELIKQLRQTTGNGVQDCRKALEQAQENYEKALEILRQQGEEQAVKRMDRPASQGTLELYSHGNGRVGVMVEVNCETEFAARSKAFQDFAHEIALQVAAAEPLYVRDEDIPAEALEEEAQKAAGRARADGKPETIIPKIVDGTLNKYKDKNVLLRQAYIRDDKISVEQLLHQAVASVRENIIIRRFMRWELTPGEEDG